MIDITAAEQFVHANARLIDRHRLAVLLHDAPAAPVLAALRAYRTPDGGFGHGLEPDVRCPGSQTSAVLQALEILVGADALDDPLVDELGDWLTTITNSDGGVPTVLPSADGHPRAPWMVPAPESSFLTYAIAGKLWQAGSKHAWLPKATEWCWTTIEQADGVGGYTVKFALDFLDAVPDPARAAAAVERFRSALDANGNLPVEGGTEDEKITPITLSPHPGTPSRALFTTEQLGADLDRLEAEQLDDGGWDVDYLHWSPGQGLDWRGIATIQAITTLRTNGRL
ncbi:hypothetical protein [Kribbella sp. DT2]|uniref:hypothetical protein n=1 Tax=Kribbella sp. DT2 TaxID=3393427 RepID=UPI003CED76C0